MRADYINSLMVYFDDIEIETLRGLASKLKKQSERVGLKKDYTPDEIELIGMLDGLFKQEKQEARATSSDEKKK